MLKITKFGGSSVANAEQFKKIKNIQPLTVNLELGNLALAHNGNLINAQM